MLKRKIIVILAILVSISTAAQDTKLACKVPVPEKFTNKDDKPSTIKIFIPIIWYVDDDAPSGGNGRDWPTAFKHLQDALTNPYMGVGDQIWVGQGLYEPDVSSIDPDGTSDRTATFQLINGIPVKGGYAGYNAPDPDERDIANYQTILSGDLGNNDNNDDNDGIPPDFANHGENSYHVVIANGVGESTLLEGFIIMGGNASGWNYPAGWGGGMQLVGSELVVKKCIFESNRANEWGGAVFIGATGKRPKFIDCVFNNNRADGVDGEYEKGVGGAVKMLYSSTEFSNCIFSDNYANQGGGAICQAYGNAKITNCTFSENYSWYDGAGKGAVMYFYFNEAQITNCLIWNDHDSGDDETIYVETSPSGPEPSVTYCNVFGGYPGTGNIEADPLFIHPGRYYEHYSHPYPYFHYPKGPDGKFFTNDDGLQLRYNSPCIDVADDVKAPATDILGRSRVDIPTIGFANADIGAYEVITAPPWIINQLKISGGEDHTLLIHPNKDGDERVWACGSGPLGNPDYSSSNLIVPVKGKDNIGFLENIDFIDAGWQHSLASDNTDKKIAWAWGYNSQGQIGDGSPTGTSRQTPVEVHKGEKHQSCANVTFLENIIQVAAGRSGEYSLAFDSEGFAWAWGLNGNGQLGNGVTGGNELEPVQILAGQQSYPTCYEGDINKDGIVDNFDLDILSSQWLATGCVCPDYCEGADINEDGTVNFTDQAILSLNWMDSTGTCIKETGFLGNVVDIDAAISHSTALDANGYVWCWGYNGSGQLGNGEKDSGDNTPVQVLGEGGIGFLTNIIDVAVATGDSSYAMDASGNVWAWGNGSNGQLGQGDGDTGDHSTPVKVKGGEMDTDYLENIVAISAGSVHALALDQDGNVWAWGDNGSSQLGDGTTTTRYTPVQVKKIDANSGFLTNIFHIDAGMWHSLAIERSGNCWGWGSNSGKLGLGPQKTGNQEYAQIMITQIPVNDQCKDTLPVIINREYRGSTYLAEDGNVWYSFTPETRAYFDISLCHPDTNFDTVLRLWDACGGTLLAENDDYCGSQSQITYKLTPGNTYIIEVAGYSNYKGEYVMTVTPSDKPVNDECEDALPVVINQDYTGSTDDAKDKNIWYSFTPEAGGSVDISLCGSDFDTTLTVYDACGGTNLAENEDSNVCYAGSYQSHISAFGVTSGETYFIQVWSDYSDSGDYILNITPN